MRMQQTELYLTKYKHATLLDVKIGGQLDFVRSAACSCLVRAVQK